MRQNIPLYFPNVVCDMVVNMVNHIYGIFFIVGTGVGAKNFSPLQSRQRLYGTTKTIGSIVRGFKIGLTKWMRRHMPVQNIWQRNYFEHVIRGDGELKRIYGILFIVDAGVGAKNISPLQSRQRPYGTTKTIGSIVRGFKIGVNKRIVKDNSGKWDMDRTNSHVGQMAAPIKKNFEE